MAYSEINKTIMNAQVMLFDINRKLVNDCNAYKAFKKIINAQDLLSKAMLEINKLNKEDNQ